MSCAITASVSSSVSGGRAPAPPTLSTTEWTTASVFSGSGSEGAPQSLEQPTCVWWVVGWPPVPDCCVCCCCDVLVQSATQPTCVCHTVCCGEGGDGEGDGGTGGGTGAGGAETGVAGGVASPAAAAGAGTPPVTAAS